MKPSKIPGEARLPKSLSQTCAMAHPPEARCECGQLVAKLSDTGIELKCKRCKRLVLVPFSTLHAGQATISICENHESPLKDPLSLISRKEFNKL